MAKLKSRLGNKRISVRSYKKKGRTVSAHTRVIRSVQKSNRLNGGVGVGLRGELAGKEYIDILAGKKIRFSNAELAKQQGNVITKPAKKQKLTRKQKDLRRINKKYSGFHMSKKTKHRFFHKK